MGVSHPLDQVFAALADPTRRDIVARLSDGDTTLTELAGDYEMSIQAVSRHLKVLEQAGLVSRTRDGKRRPARLETAPFDAMTSWIERYRRRAERRYRRLDALLERMNDPDSGESHE